MGALSLGSIRARLRSGRSLLSTTITYQYSISIWFPENWPLPSVTCAGQYNVLESGVGKSLNFLASRRNGSPFVANHYCTLGGTEPRCETDQENTNARQRATNKGLFVSPPIRRLEVLFVPDVARLSLQPGSPTLLYRLLHSSISIQLPYEHFS